MKYMGSKSRWAKYILPIILNERDEGQYYVEPFCGGCNTIDKVTGNRIASDANKYLIAMWKFLTQTQLEFPREISKEIYSYWRSVWHKRNCLDITSVDAMIGWIGFMGSFNGRFFDGGYSGHSVRSGNTTRDYISEQIKNTMSQIDNLRGVEFVHSDYYDLQIPPHSIIYCDPPYRNTKQYSNISENFDYDKFYQWARQKRKEGHIVYVSEYSMPSDFPIVWEKESKNRLNPYLTKNVVERLYTI